MALTYSRVRFEAEVRRRPGRPRILSEGDSWFSYPLTINLVRRLHDLDPTVNWLRLEHNGAEILDIVGDPDTDDALDEGAVGARLAYQARRLRGLLRRPLTRPDVILLSAGGNDLLGRELERILRPLGTYRARVPAGGPEAPARAVVLTRLDATLERVASAIHALLVLRDRALPAAHRCPVIVHSYCAAQPRPVRGPFGIGPWLHPAFAARGYPPAEAPLMLTVVRFLVSRFRDRLLALASARGVRDLEVVDLTGCFALAPAGYHDPPASGDWHDELHPGDAGFAKLAEAFRPALRRALPGSAW